MTDTLDAIATVGSSQPIEDLTPVAKFFALEETQHAIMTYLIEVRAASAASDPALTHHLVTMLDAMVKRPDIFDRYCTVNIGWVGNNMLSHMIGARVNELHLEDVFGLAYRFVTELEFTRASSFPTEFHAVTQYVQENLAEFPESLRRMLTFAHYIMPASITRELLHHPRTADARSLLDAMEGAARTKKAWDEDIAAKTKELEGLRSELKHLTSEYNFVGLVDGFKKLRKTKVGEKHFAFGGLVLLAILMLAPPALELYFVTTNTPAEIAKYQGALLYTLPALITVEVLLVYLFRVVLGHFRSLKAQLLQLDLRVALCQFIQSYAEYADKLKKQSQTSLEKFEGVIFSGLMATEEALPATFDGMEQLTKLVAAMRAKP